MTDRVVRIDFRKWPDRLHWQFDMYYLDEDEWGTWLFTPGGSMAQRGHEPAVRFSHSNVKLIRPNAWWTAIWNDSGNTDLYIDIITPPVWNGDRVTMVDIDLDLQRLHDGTVNLLDADEFASHQILYEYPQDVISRSVSETKILRMMLRDRIEPFGDVGRQRMAQASELGKSSPPLEM